MVHRHRKAKGTPGRCPTVLLAAAVAPATGRLCAEVLNGNNNRFMCLHSLWHIDGRYLGSALVHCARCGPPAHTSGDGCHAGHDPRQSARHLRADSPPPPPAAAPAVRAEKSSGTRREIVALSPNVNTLATDSSSRAMDNQLVQCALPTQAGTHGEREEPRGRPMSWPMSWSEAVRAAGLAALADRTAPAARAPRVVPYRWDPYEIWLSRARPAPERTDLRIAPAGRATDGT